MKVKRISMLALVLLLMMSATAMAAKWEWIYSTDEDGWYFDADSITYKINIMKKIEDDVICYWEKHIYTEQAANELAEKIHDERFEQLSYVLSYNEIDKMKKTRSIRETIFYDVDGKTIGSLPAYYGTRDEKIAPGTVGELIIDTVVAYCKEHHKEILSRTKG